MRAAFDQMGADFQYMHHSPMFAAYAQVAPDPEAFPKLMDKMGDLNRRPFDWTEEIKALSATTMLVYADADSVALAHIAEFFQLLGGGLVDAGVDGSARPRARLAVLPGLTHYDIFDSSQLLLTLEDFLATSQ